MKQPKVPSIGFLYQVSWNLLLGVAKSLPKPRALERNGKFYNVGAGQKMLQTYLTKYRYIR